jgi:hypothetical protein
MTPMRSAIDPGLFRTLIETSQWLKPNARLNRRAERLDYKEPRDCESVILFVVKRTIIPVDV